MDMGEKRRTKSKGKTAKATKHGLRPHEQREQRDAFKAAAPVASSPLADRKIPKM
jgi:hypothetical protein